MRKVLLASAFAFVATVALASSANAVPSFTRQTGLTCNQCHVTFSNVPDFTFTGKKFRLNAYRTPYVAEKIEAGEEGALSGNRLVLGIQNIFSLRFRNVLLSQSKAATDAATPDPGKGPVTTQPGTTISWFYVGGIGENIGLWNEFYLDAVGNASASAAPFRINTFDEFDLKFAFNPGYENIVGFAITTQSLQDLAGFNPFNSGTPSAMQRGGISSAHTAYVNLGAYTLIKDRFLIIAGTQPGEDNYSFSDGMNTQGIIAYALGNTDKNQAWVNFNIKAGNDGVPIVSNPSLNSDRAITYSEAIAGVTALHKDAAGKALGAYTPANTGDFVRTLAEVLYGFVDRGPHSFTGGAGISNNRETYDDGAEIKQTAIGLRGRYFYDRTYGVEYTYTKQMKNDFTDSTGKLHKASTDWNGTSATFFYRPAMNFSFSLGVGINRTLGQKLDDTRVVRNGWSWNLGYDFFF
jgi:hypothetical protein